MRDLTRPAINDTLTLGRFFINREYGLINFERFKGQPNIYLTRSFADFCTTIKIINANKKKYVHQKKEWSFSLTCWLRRDTLELTIIINYFIDNISFNKCWQCFVSYLKDIIRQMKNCIWTLFHYITNFKF